MSQFARVAEYTNCISADSPNNCPVGDTKQSDGEALVMLDFLGPHLAEVVALDRVLSMGQIELNCVLMLN